MQAGAPRYVSGLLQPFHSGFTVAGSDGIVTQYRQDSRLAHLHVLAPRLFQAVKQHSPTLVRPWRGEQKAGLSQVGGKRKVHIGILGGPHERLIEEPNSVRWPAEFGKPFSQCSESLDLGSDVPAHLGFEIGRCNHSEGSEYL